LVFSRGLPVQGALDRDRKGGGRKKKKEGGKKKSSERRLGVQQSEGGDAYHAKDSIISQKNGEEK